MSNLSPSPMLSAEQIEAFFEIGFVIVPDVFTPTEIEENASRDLTVCKKWPTRYRNPESTTALILP